MKVLVTGSSGFLGSHVARVIHQAGHQVTGFDQQPGSTSEYETVVGDLLDVEGLTKAAKGQDALVHIGAIGDVYLAASQPALAAAVNVTGSANIATAAKSAGARVIYASTWEVYGAPRYEPVDEEHPCEPDHPYNITKLAGERMLLAADHLDDVPTVALRLGTAYGLGMRPNSVFEIFIRKAMAGESITIQGDGSQGRQFTHASDIARAFLLATESDIRGVALNTVARDMTTIKQLAEIVTEHHPTEVVFGDPRPGDVPPSYVSAERIGDKLGWKAEMTLEAGMAELFAVDRPDPK